MEGRRVSRRRPRRNPLYVLFMALLAAAVILLITAIVLGAKLRSARSALAEAQTKIEQLQNGGSQQAGEPDYGDGAQTGGEESDPSGSGDAPQSDGAPAGSASGDVIDWLDLSGHSEVAVKPGSVYDKYYVYYTTNGVNLRGGPGTSYDRVKLLDLGTEVKAAAKQDGWTFVSADGKFGWINSDYLSTTRPEPQRSSEPERSASSGSGADSSAAGSSDAAGAPADGAASGGDEIPDWLKTGN